MSLSIVTLPALADTVWLKNGDRLTGKISVLDGGKLLIETEYGGSIPVKWKQVATLESDQQLTTTFPSTPRLVMVFGATTQRRTTTANTVTA